MTENWTEGKPSEDGLYAVVVDVGGNTYGRLVRRRTDAMEYVSFHWVEGGYLETCDSSMAWTILRHIRLPEPQKPLELPQRFRAKLNGTTVVGCRAGSCELYVTDPKNLRDFYSTSKLTDIQWEPQPESQT